MKTCVTHTPNPNQRYLTLSSSQSHILARKIHTKREREFQTYFIHCFDLPKKEEDEKSFEQRERSRVSETFVAFRQRGEEKIVLFFSAQKKVKNRTVQVFTESESVGFLESNQSISNGCSRSHFRRMGR